MAAAYSLLYDHAHRLREAVPTARNHPRRTARAQAAAAAQAAAPAPRNDHQVKQNIEALSEALSWALRQGGSLPAAKVAKLKAMIEPLAVPRPAPPTAKVNDRARENQTKHAGAAADRLIEKLRHPEPPISDLSIETLGAILSQLADVQEPSRSEPRPSVVVDKSAPGSRRSAEPKKGAAPSGEDTAP